MNPEPREVEPRWPSILASISTGVLFYAMPETLTLGPGWLPVTLVGTLTIPAVMARRAGKTRLNEIFAYLSLSVVTLALVSSLFLLITRLPGHKESPVQLLKAAVALWVSNILVFASWYWRLDAGGPNQRDMRGAHTDGAFLFPQMLLDPETRKLMGEDRWSPGFVDYLFLAFNTSTAFSPTDVPVLSRWAKALMMVQSIVALATVALLGARAVNIL